MGILEIIAEIQARPGSVSAYRKMARHFASSGMTHEAEAILALAEARNGNHRSDRDAQQQGDNRPALGVD